MASGDADENVVKKILEDFLTAHGGKDPLSSMDEYALTYIVSILKNLCTGETEDDAFDVEDITEMMQSYLPDAFESIDSMAVTEWLIELAGSMKSKPENGTSPSLSFCPPPSAAITIDNNKPAANKKKSPRVHTVSDGSTVSGGSAVSLSESSPRSSVSGSMEDACAVSEQSMQLLADLFPGACRLEVVHCLSTAEGDVDRAAQLLLHRQDSGDAITMDDIAKPVQISGKKAAKLNDTDMKKHIVDRYSFVDTEADKRDHRPVMPKKELKKMTRYRDGKVVSTKGERFTEIKKRDDEEQQQKMKQTYVNLKPAKQYRFH